MPCLVINLQSPIITKMASVLKLSVISVLMETHQRWMTIQYVLISLYSPPASVYWCVVYILCSCSLVSRQPKKEQGLYSRSCNLLARPMATPTLQDLSMHLRYRKWQAAGQRHGNKFHIGHKIFSGHKHYSTRQTETSVFATGQAVWSKYIINLPHTSQQGPVMKLKKYKSLKIN